MQGRRGSHLSPAVPPCRPQALAVHFEGEGEEEEGEVTVPGQGQEEEPVSLPTQETVQVRERKWGRGAEHGGGMFLVPASLLGGSGAWHGDVASTPLQLWR